MNWLQPNNSTSMIVPKQKIVIREQWCPSNPHKARTSDESINMLKMPPVLSETSVMLIAYIVSEYYMSESMYGGIGNRNQVRTCYIYGPNEFLVLMAME